MIARKTKRYFDFLKYSLTPDAAPPLYIQDMDWEGLYTFANRQALLGIIFEGIKLLPEGTIKDVGLLVKWATFAKKINMHNKSTFVACRNLSDQYASLGFRNMVLKGQGAALRYPNPLARTSGDIDLYVDGGHAKVLAFVDKEYGIAGRFNTHHVDVPPFEGVNVELHYRCATLRNPFDNARLQKWFDRHIDVQLNHSSCCRIDGQEITFNTPTIAFNAVYELVHIYNHFMFEGIGMRQLVDYYMLLQNCEDTEVANVIREDIKKLNLTRIAAAVMWVLQETLGLDKKKQVARPNEKLGRFLLTKILEGGNFGIHDKEVQSFYHGNQVSQYLRRLKRSMLLSLYFPREAMWDAYFRYKQHTWQRRVLNEINTYKTLKN